MAKGKRRTTKHGKQRISKRMNVSKIRAETIANAAIKKGVMHSDTLGDLRNYINKLAMKSKKDHLGGLDFRIYQDFIFIFRNGKLITSWELSEDLKKKSFIKFKCITNGKKPFKDSTDPEGKFDGEEEIIAKSKIQSSKTKSKSSSDTISSSSPKTVIKREIEKIFNEDNPISLEESINRIEDSCLSEKNKDLAIYGIEKKYFEIKEIPQTHEDAIKYNEFCVTAIEPIILEESDEKDEEEAKAWARGITRTQINRLLAQTSERYWTLSMSSEISLEILQKIKNIALTTKPHILKIIENEARKYYLLSFRTYFPELYLKQEYMEMRNNATLFSNMYNLRHSNRNKRLDKIKNGNQILKTKGAHPILGKCINIADSFYTEKTCKDIMLLDNEILKEICVLSGKYANAVLMGIHKYYLSKVATVEPAKYAWLANRLSGAKSPIFSSENPEVIKDEFSQWVEGTEEAFIIISLLTNNQLDKECLIKTIKNNIPNIIKKFKYTGNSINKKIEFIKENYDLRLLEIEKYIISKSQDSFYSLISTKSSFENGGVGL